MENKDFTYKKATLDDVTLINQLAVEIWNEHYSAIITQNQINYMLDLMYSVSVLKKEIETGYEFYIAYKNSKPTAYLAIHEEENCNWFLDKFYVKKEYRGLKLGSSFFSNIEYLLKKRDIKQLRLFVNRENYKSVNFYFKCGFKIESVIDKPIGEGYYMNDFVMLKKYTI